MARIVLTTWGSYGDLFPILGLALALKGRGHRPLLATSAYYRAIVEPLGVDFHPVPPDVDPNDLAFVARVMNPRRGSEVLLRDVLAPSVREAYAAIDAAAAGADLLVSHPATLATPLVAQRRGLRWVSTVLAPLAFFSRYDFPVLPALPFATHLNALGPTACGWLRAGARWATGRMLAPVVTLRDELGLPDTGVPLFEGQFSPLGTLALFPSVLAEPQPDWPERVTRAGFVSYNGPDPMPQSLLDFLDDGPPPVAFTLGTSAVGAPGAFFTEAALACGQVGCRGVLLVGRNPANHPAGPLPPGVIAVDYAPHQALFPRASVIVHQGGMGTTSQALRAGKPQLVVPHAHDQPDNAQRVNRLGVGRVCQPGRFRASRVAARLQELLAGAEYRRKAEAVGSEVRAEDGATAACDALEEALKA